MKIFYWLSNKKIFRTEKCAVIVDFFPSLLKIQSWLYCCITASTAGLKFNNTVCLIPKYYEIINMSHFILLSLYTKICEIFNRKTTWLHHTLPFCYFYPEGLIADTVIPFVALRKWITSWKGNSLEPISAALCCVTVCGILCITPTLIIQCSFQENEGQYMNIHLHKIII